MLSTQATIHEKDLHGTLNSLNSDVMHITRARAYIQFKCDRIVVFYMKAYLTLASVWILTIVSVKVHCWKNQQGE